MRFGVFRDTLRGVKGMKLRTGSVKGKEYSWTLGRVRDEYTHWSCLDRDEVLGLRGLRGIKPELGL